jgi:anti-sigma B factor antagonist
MSSATVLQFRGELGLADAAGLRDSLMTAIRDSDSDLLVLDMSEVTFVEASVVGVILGARNRLDAAGRELRLAAVQGKVLRTLTMMGLDQLGLSYPTVQAACGE